MTARCAPNLAACTRTSPWRRVGAAVLLAACSMAVQAGEVTVAVAANFAAPMARIAESFRLSTGHVAKLSTGSTGKFYSQIVAGAPFDVLLAADDETPQRLVKEGHAVAGTAFTYAIGQLVLWSAQQGLVDEQGAVLASGRFKHLAVANPRTAPYGAAAMQVLQKRGLLPVLQGRLVTGESVGQTYQFVVTGNAELGFVSLSQVQKPGAAVGGSMWRVPAALHDQIRQDAVLLFVGRNNPAARALMDHLKTPAVRAVIDAHGYRPPSPP